MSFFSETKNAGLAFMIVGILSILGGIIAVILGAMGYKVDDATVFTIGGAVTAIGTIIYGVLYFGYGQKVRSGAISAKIEILAMFVALVGVGTIITGIFSAIGAAVDGTDLGAVIVSVIISIILGLIILFISKKINDGKQTTGDKIIWILLLIIFAICIILAILEIITIIGIITGICHLIIYVFMMILLLDNEVKSAMGM
jgi:hypothetical protein